MMITPTHRSLLSELKTDRTLNSQPASLHISPEKGEKLLETYRESLVDHFLIEDNGPYDNNPTAGVFENKAGTSLKAGEFRIELNKSENTTTIVERHAVDDGPESFRIHEITADRIVSLEHIEPQGEESRSTAIILDSTAGVYQEFENPLVPFHSLSWYDNEPPETRSESLRQHIIKGLNYHGLGN
jgi:hypothetical protein